MLAVHDSEIYGFDSESLADHVERSRVAATFEKYVADVLAGRGRLVSDYFTDEEPAVSAQSVTALSTFTMRSYLGYAGGVYRWTAPTYTFKTNGAQPPLDATSSASTASTAVGRWNSAGGSNVHISVSGTTSSTTGLTSADGQNTILFNDPANEFPQLVGFAAAVGGVNNQGGSQALPDGSGSANPPTEVDIVVAKNFSPVSCLSIILTHEAGHTLGFRHADKDSNESPCALPLDCSSGFSVMNATVACSLSSLQPWEVRAVATVYGSGCAAPSITTDPASTSIGSGTSTDLSVGATGIAPLTYQWYTGAKSDTSNPIIGQTLSSITVSPTSTTSYWVRVSNPCGSSDSNAATVTVTCTAPQINTQPSGSTITYGNAAQVSVTATGGTLTYQWYIGAKGVTSNPVFNGTTSSISVSPASTTSYWVHITNSCGFIDSNAATVTVNCASPTVTATPSSRTITQGSSTLFSAIATGGPNLTLQWYTGAAGDTSSPILGQTGATLTVSPSATTSYWVQATVPSCGPPVNSNTVTVTVNPNNGCPPVTISTPTVTQDGANYTLATTASTGNGGGTVSITWYQQTDTGQVAIGTGPSIIVSPTVTTTYAALASNTCGSSNSATVTVTIGPSGCTAPTVTQPSDQTIGLGASTTITVTATGSGTLHYQWYQGAAGDTSVPVGTDSATLATGALETNSTFWVKVTNDCSSSTSSETVTISVEPARRRSVHH